MQSRYYSRRGHFRCRYLTAPHRPLLADSCLSRIHDRSKVAKFPRVPGEGARAAQSHSLAERGSSVVPSERL